MPGGRQLYAAITCIYAITRLALYLCGVRFGVSYRWYFLHDIDLLKNRFCETLFYTHDFPPFMNVFVGAVLKLSERQSAVIYQGTYLVLGWAFVASMAYLMAALRFRARGTLVVVTLFCCSPPFIYLENLLHHEFVAASLLAVAGVLLHRALATGRWPWLLSLFADCAAISLLRASFHLVWVLFVVGLVAFFYEKNRRVVLAAALAPVLAVVAVYAKNFALFGFFGISSWTGFNLANVTILRLSEGERRAWIDEGKIHPVSGIRLYSGLTAYAPYVDLSQKRGVPVLDRLEHAEGMPNFNHWAYIELSRLRMADDRYYLSQRRREYLETVVAGVVDYFGPTTRWHPLDPTGSPHREIRETLEPWENLYNRAVHGGRFGPFGRYLILVGFIVYGVGAALRAAWRQRFKGCLEEKVVLFLAFCCFYVPGLSCLVEIGELERYRFTVEAFMWIVGLWGVRRALESVGRESPSASA
jgi:hypothetical protein